MSQYSRIEHTLSHLTLLTITFSFLSTRCKIHYISAIKRVGVRVFLAPFPLVFLRVLDNKFFRKISCPFSFTSSQALVHNLQFEENDEDGKKGNQNFPYHHTISFINNENETLSGKNTGLDMVLVLQRVRKR